MNINNCSAYFFLFFRPLTRPGRPFQSSVQGHWSKFQEMTRKKNHRKIIASKMTQETRTTKASNCLEDLESYFDTPSSSDDTDFESNYFLSF